MSATSTTSLDPLTIPVSGMTCAHCVSTVRQAIEALPGVRSADVSLSPGSAQVEFEPGLADVEAVKQAIHAAGYGTEAEPSKTPRLVSIGGPIPTAPVTAPLSKFVPAPPW